MRHDPSELRINWVVDAGLIGVPRSEYGLITIENPSEESLARVCVRFLPSAVAGVRGDADQVSNGPIAYRERPRPSSDDLHCSLTNLTGQKASAHQHHLKAIGPELPKPTSNYTPE